MNRTQAMNCRRGMCWAWLLVSLVAACGGGNDDGGNVGGGTDAAANTAAAYNLAADTVRVGGGTVGASLDSTKTMRIFKAIPYAAPPIGSLRWQPPQSVRAWTGTRRTSQIGAACMQSTAATTFTSILLTDVPSVSENCLLLNVWTGAADASEKRPVMVLFQGGNNRSGSASNPTYSGAGLASKGAVVVTFNYRVGVFGWMAHPELTTESSNHVSGNYGLLDQLAALKWVQANIAGFGGDPGNVTVFAQSAGAWDANVLMASPLAKGLMQRIVLESGGYFPGVRGNLRTLAQAETAGTAFSNMAKAANLAALRAMPATDLLTLQGNSFDTSPALDGYVLADQIDNTFRSGAALDVPVLAGWNADDNNVFPPGFATTFAGFQTSARALFGDAGVSQIQALYHISDDASAAAVRFLLPNDFELAWQPYTLARTMNAHYRSKAYLYRFERVPPYYPDQVNYAEAADPAALGAYHTIEQVYFYNNLASWPRPYTAVDQRLADITSTYLVNFATSGDPNSPRTRLDDGGSLPQWPAFVSSGGQIMRMNDTSAAGALPNQPALDLFDTLFAQKTGRPLAFQ